MQRERFSSATKRKRRKKHKKEEEKEKRYRIRYSRMPHQQQRSRKKDSGKEKKKSMTAATTIGRAVSAAVNKGTVQRNKQISRKIGSTLERATRQTHVTTPILKTM